MKDSGASSSMDRASTDDSDMEKTFEIDILRRDLGD